MTRFLALAGAVATLAAAAPATAQPYDPTHLTFIQARQAAELTAETMMEPWSDRPAWTNVYGCARRNSYAIHCRVTTKGDRAGFRFGIWLVGHWTGYVAAHAGRPTMIAPRSPTPLAR